MPQEFTGCNPKFDFLMRHGGVEPLVARAWKTQIDRRSAKIEAGKVKGLPLEQSLARPRKIAGLCSGQRDPLPLAKLNLAGWPKDSTFRREDI